MKERGEIEDTLFFRNSVDKEKFLPELKILLSKGRFKKKKILATGSHEFPR